MIAPLAVRCSRQAFGWVPAPVPHVRMCERAFVLAPLAEIAPDAIHPVRQMTIRDLLAELTGQ